MQLDGNKAYGEFIKAGIEYADREAAASVLEELKKSVLAKLKLQSDGKSDAEREMHALAHTEYTKHLHNMIEARRMATIAKVRYEAIRVLCEMRRTEESTRRTEMQFVQRGGAN